MLLIEQLLMKASAPPSANAQPFLNAWGVNNSGQLGDGTTTTRSSPVQIGTSSWAAVSTGGGSSGFFSAAIRSDGALFTWGLNAIGQLGDGTTVSKSSPVQIGTSSWTAVSTGFSHAAAIRSDGALFTWGLNGAGQLGDGTRLDKSSPVQVGSSSWTAVAAGRSHTAAIRSDGGLFTWGINNNNNAGQLGDGTRTARSSPVQIGSSSWTAVAAGGSHTVAIRSDGALFTWGFNSNGQLGDGTTTARSSPVQIGTSSWTAVAAGTSHTLGISGNLLYTWGLNFSGQLGQGTSGFTQRSSPSLVGSNVLPDSDRSSPVQVGTQSWSVVAAGFSHAGAIRANGGLYLWGFNFNGQLGQNNIINTISPVQVGTRSFTLISVGRYHTIAR